MVAGAKGRAGNRRLTELSEATLKGRTEQVGGEVAELAPDRLDRFFLREGLIAPPASQLRAQPGAGGAEGRQSEGVGGEIGGWEGDADAANESVDVGEAGVDAADGAMDAVGYELVSAPAMVPTSTLGCAQTAKRVDVKALKECIWGLIQEMTGGRQGGVVGFQAVMEGLQGRYPAGHLAAVSVSYCFICALHLCNEHGLTLEAVEGDEEGEQRSIASAPADVGYNLTAFSIRAS